MEYDIIYGATSQELVKAVNKKRADGFSPQGGVQVIRRDYEDRDGYSEVAYEFYQAVTKNIAQ